MALIRCPSCGRRMLDSQVLRFCTNCGAPLQMREDRREQEWIPEASLPVPAPAAPTEALQPVEQQRALIPRPGRAVSRLSGPRRELEEYQATTMPQPYERPPEWLKLPYGEGGTTIVTEEVGVGTLWEATRDGGPWWFPRRTPEIAGTLIHVQTQQESWDHADVAGAIFRLFTDMLWGIAGESSQHHHRGGREGSMVTMLRVRTSDGAQRDARLRGHLTGANLTLGDKVSLWGWKRRGTLVVRRGFNHTSKSVISSSGTRSAKPMLILLFMLALVFYLWTYWGHAPFWPR